MPDQFNFNLDDTLPAFKALASKLGEITENHAKMERVNSMSMKVDPIKGTASIDDLPMELLNEFAMAKKNMAHIEAIHTRNIQETEQRLAYRSQHPFASTLAQIAAGVASQDPNAITRGLGIAATRLNPTTEELKAREGAEAGQLAGLTEKRLGMGVREEELRLESERTKQIRSDKTETMAEKRQASLVKALEFSEKHGDSPQSIEQAKKVFGLDDEQTKLLGNLVEDRQKRTKETRDYQTRVNEFRRETALKVQAMRDATATKLMSIRQDDISGRQAAGREDRGYAKVEKDVTAALTTVGGTQHMREVLADPKNTKWIGMILGKYPTDLIPDPVERQRVADVKAEFFTLMNDVRNSFGAGARFWNPTEFAALSPKLAQASKTLATNEGIIDAIERDAIRNAKKLVQASPDVDWAKRGPLVFADLWPKIESAAKGGGLQGPAGGAKKTDTGKTEVEKWHRDANGQLVKSVS